MGRKADGQPMKTVSYIVSNQKGNTMAKNCRVYCKNLDIWFSTITAAAKHAGVDGWTMSLKMDTAGSFIDKYGNEYIRERPMATKNRYKSTGVEMHHEVKKHKRKPNEIAQRVKDGLFHRDYTPIKPKSNDFVFADLPAPVRELIEEKINDMFRADVPWSKIKEFMLKMGCKKLTLTLADL